MQNEKQNCDSIVVNVVLVVLAVCVAWACVLGIRANRRLVALENAQGSHNAPTLMHYAWFQSGIQVPISGKLDQMTPVDIGLAALGTNYVMTWRLR